MQINRLVDLMKDEEEMYLEKFDTVRFDNRIRELVQEITAPLALDTKKILTDISRNSKECMRLDAKVFDTLDKLDRASQQLNDFHGIVYDLESIKQKFE